MDGSEELAVESESEADARLKEIVLHLKAYDTAPLNCTISFMAQGLGRTTQDVYKGVGELVSLGVVEPWEQWQRGAITPYRISSLSKLIDHGVELSYGEMVSLTQPGGGPHAGAPLTAVESGVGGAGRNYLISLPAREILKEISLKVWSLGLVRKLAPKRQSDAKRAESLARDYELSYLNIFFRSLFGVRDTEPLYAIFAEGEEDIDAFRKRLLAATLRSLAEISEGMLEVLGGEEPPRREYVYFYACMLDRYLRLAKELGVAKADRGRLVELRKKMLKEEGDRS